MGLYATPPRIFQWIVSLWGDYSDYEVIIIAFLFWYTTHVGVLDYLFPKYCCSCGKLGSYLCDTCFSRLSFDTRLPCSVCNRPSFDGLTHPVCKKRYSLDGMFASLVYNRPVKKLIASFKYKPYVSNLEFLLSSLFIEGIIQNEVFMKIVEEESVFVPIPLHVSKKRQRGYNHAELLARQLQAYFQYPVSISLIRVKQTVSQFGLSREKRKENLHNAFSLSKEIDCKQVILIDDIVTSGVTFTEAASVLKKQGVGKVYGIALAHGK